MNRELLHRAIKEKNSFLCVGLDTDPDRIPKHLLRADDPVFEFNRQIIDATHQYCIAYKPNLAFYEAQGAAGWESLQKTLDCIPDGIFTIADAKRGDIGNTSDHYAKAFFEMMNFDAITVAPYMGRDSIISYLKYPGKMVALLALTSNAGSSDFQMLKSGDHHLFEEVVIKAKDWGNPDQLMFVVGATQGDLIKKVRDLAPEHFFLVPGVGAQGGNLNEVVQWGMNKQDGLIVNASRSIIYASAGKHFAEKAGEIALKMQLEMKRLLEKYHI